MRLVFFIYKTKSHFFKRLLHHVSRAQFLPFCQLQYPCHGFLGLLLVGGGEVGDDLHAGDVGVAGEEVVSHLEAETRRVMARSGENVCGDSSKQRDFIALITKIDMVGGNYNGRFVVSRQIETGVPQCSTPAFISIYPAARILLQQLRKTIDVIEMGVR